MFRSTATPYFILYLAISSGDSSQDLSGSFCTASPLQGNRNGDFELKRNKRA